MKAQWTIGKKLIVSFLVVAAITAALGVIGFYGVNKSSQAIDEIGIVRLPSVESLLIMSGQQKEVDSAENALLSTGLDPATRQAQYQRFDNAKKLAEAAWKIYEPLPQTTEEARVWKEFVPAWEKWWNDHDDYVKLARQFDSTDIANPPAFQRDIHQFIGDHYRLHAKLINHIEKGNECSGGDDHTACNFGKWMATLQTNNPGVLKAIEAAKTPHAAFHKCVHDAKELIAKGDKENALKIANGEMKELQNKIFAEFDSVQKELNQANAIYEKMNHQTLVVNGESFGVAEKLLNRLVEINRQIASDTTKTSVAQSKFLNVLSSTSSVIGVCLAIALGIIIGRRITKALQNIVASLSTGAEQVASAAGQVSAASQSLAEGATEQAAGLEETSSSLEEMSSMTKQNADNAQQANTLAAETRNTANNGSEAMNRMSSAIKDIQKSADETAKIIKVIDEIAFQTNLLALNAAVEAARAGEAGKGFAVVAEEVRNLAMRSAEAAKNTANMIEESVKNAKNGVDIATEVGKVLEEIVQSIGKTTDLVGEIAAASSEQAQGIDQVNTAVAQMDKVTQQNAANAEESASASEELSAQAEQMNQIVRDLTALVGGSKTENRQAAVAHKTEQNRLTTFDHKIHNISTSTSKKKSQVVSKSKVAKTIPFNDDDELKDFNS